MGIIFYKYSSWLVIIILYSLLYVIKTRVKYYFYDMNQNEYIFSYIILNFYFLDAIRALKIKYLISKHEHNTFVYELYWFYVLSVWKKNIIFVLISEFVFSNTK